MTDSRKRGPGRKGARFTAFWGEGSPTKIGYRKKVQPYSNLSTGGPRKGEDASQIHRFGTVDVADLGVIHR